MIRFIRRVLLSVSLIAGALLFASVLFPTCAFTVQETPENHRSIQIWPGRIVYVDTTGHDGTWHVYGPLAKPKLARLHRRFLWAIGQHPYRFYAMGTSERGMTVGLFPLAIITGLWPILSLLNRRYWRIGKTKTERVGSDFSNR